MILKLKRTPGIYLVGFMGSGKTTVGRGPVSYTHLDVYKRQRKFLPKFAEP